MKLNTGQCWAADCQCKCTIAIRDIDYNKQPRHNEGLFALSDKMRFWYPMVLCVNNCMLIDTLDVKWS